MDMKIGDKVRFLSEVGGGVVKGFQGKDIALVEDEDGFEIPMLVRECVVIETDNYNIPLKPASKKEAEPEPEKEEEKDAGDSSVRYYRDSVADLPELLELG